MDTFWILFLALVGGIFGFFIGKDSGRKERINEETKEHFEKENNFYKNNNINEEDFNNDIEAYYSEYGDLYKYIDLGLPYEEDDDSDEHSNIEEEFEFWTSLWVFQYNKKTHYWRVLPIFNLIHTDRKKLTENVDFDYKTILVGFDVDKLKKRGFDFLKKYKLEFDKKNYIDKQKKIAKK